MLIFLQQVRVTEQRGFCGRHRGGKLYAIVTMVGHGTAMHADGANVLARSLHATMNHTVLRHTQLIALVGDGPGAEESKAKLSNMWTVWEPPSIRNSSDLSVMFDKLWVYELVEFERVLFIDADAFAVGDVSPLLVTPGLKSFAATPDWFDEPLQTGARVGINTGVFSVKPDEDEFFKINAFRLENPHHKQDQTLLDAYYGPPPYEAVDAKVTWFNFSYNSWLNGIADNEWPARGHWNATWAAYQPSVIFHLIGHFPPTRPAENLTDTRSAIYRKWWKLADMSESDALLAALPATAARSSEKGGTVADIDV